MNNVPPAMRRFLLATAFACLIVGAGFLALLAAVGWGARHSRPESMAVLGQVAYAAQQYWAERGCAPLVPAALFDRQVATRPAPHFDCTDERARAPLARPYMAKHIFEPRTGHLLVEVKGGYATRVSLGHESSPTGRLNFVRIEGLPPQVALRSLQECNTSDEPPSVEFVGKCRVPFPGALDLRFEQAQPLDRTAKTK